MKEIPFVTALVPMTLNMTQDSSLTGLSKELSGQWIYGIHRAKVFFLTLFPFIDAFFPSQSMLHKIVSLTFVLFHPRLRIAGGFVS
jgi:hypothetical protein